MNKKFKPIRLAFFFIIILYILDSGIYYFLSGENYTFLQVLLAQIPIGDLYSRLLMVTGIIIFGIISYGKFNELSFEHKPFQGQPKKTSEGNIDYKFLSGLSYQLRTPLNAIVGFSELLKKPELNKDSRETYVDHINNSSKFLLLLINNLSEISKIESNILSINRVETDINKIIKEFFEIYSIRQPEMGKSDIPLIIEKVKLEESFNIYTDPDRLKQVLNNLLENAFLHTVEGKVKFGYTIKDKGFIEFYVTDSGQGLSQERLEIIFERYNRLTDNKDLPFDGTLLILAISKSIVRLLGGEIWADSKAGLGVTIYFTIPYLPGEKQQEIIHPEKVAAKGVTDWTGHQVLIAEDVESNYLYLVELLKPTHIGILWAKNGKEAVKHVQETPNIDLVLMDILMPEMDGYEAAREIKKIRKDLPIVAQTAYIVEDESKNDDKKNFVSYLIKPIWAPQLISTIENYIKSV